MKLARELLTGKHIENDWIEYKKSAELPSEPPSKRAWNFTLVNGKNCIINIYFRYKWK